MIRWVDQVRIGFIRRSSPGETIRGTIDKGDLDAFTFTASPNVGVQLRVADVAQSSFVPYLAVYDPNGKVVETHYGQDVAVASFVPTLAGTYTALVYDYSSGFSSTGAYKIYLIQAPGSEEGGELSLTNPIQGAVDVGDLDSYSMTLAAGAGVQLRVVDVNEAAFVPYLVVYDPNGAVAGQHYGATVAALAFNAATAGKYTVVVYDYSNGYAGSGDYELLYARAPGSAEGGALTVGATVAETIDLGDLDTYTFTATAGDKPRVTVTDLGAGTFTPRVVVYGPTGTIVANVVHADVAAPTFTAAVSGTYTVVVYDSSSSFEATGDYSLVLSMN